MGAGAIRALLRIYRVPAPTVPQVKKRWNVVCTDRIFIDQSTFEDCFRMSVMRK